MELLEHCPDKEKDSEMRVRKREMKIKVLRSIHAAVQDTGQILSTRLDKDLEKCCFLCHCHFIPQKRKDLILMCES